MPFITTDPVLERARLVLLYNEGLYSVTELAARFGVSCTGLSSVKQEGVRAQFERLFHTYGLPEAIRSDNGVPFATQALCGLSRLSVWWIKLGIGHDRIEPGQPQQNGCHERMHKTKAETARPPERDMASQQARASTHGAQSSTGSVRTKRSTT